MTLPFRRLHLRSLSSKLLLMVMLVNFCTLLLAGLALLYHDLQETRAKTAAELVALANLLGQGSVTALEFSDPKVAAENLAQLRAAPDIVAAAIFTAQGVRFASYTRDPSQRQELPAAVGAEGVSFHNEALSVFKPVQGAAGMVGTVFLKERYDLSKWLRAYLLILAAVLLASMVFGLLISSRLQRWITRPVLAVRDVARQVMQQRSYHLRAPKTTEDEVGQLAEAFNGMLATLEHEIAERSGAEQAVRTLNADLEARVLARTEDLEVANRSLEVRTTEAESANRAKADFLANMSHEIRTPMNGILGLAYLLDRRALDPDSAELVRKIRNAGRSLQAIINDILDFSKIEAGRLEIEHAPFRLADVFDNLASIMAANAGDKDIELSIAPAPAVAGHLLGDALRLEQVLINLTGNAIKFTEHGGIKLGVALLAQDEKLVTLRFSVTDSGIGIPLDQQATIFSAFSQADASTTRRFGGTGLGLTICRHLVNKMGGDIGVISAPGQGSEFWFTIPFAWDAQAEYAPPELARLDVLIADDSDSARENLTLTARSVGWNPTVADSGQAALDKILARQAKNSSYDVLLVDWKMPGMDGLQLATHLRQTQGGKATPIVLMVTAFSRDELNSQADAGCVDGVLSKPVTSSMLYNGVAAALRKRGRDYGASELAALDPLAERIPGVRVLVVDDSDINREVALRILRSEGAVVELAEDGKAALNWLGAHPQAIDIVLMDVQMPEMDGYEATRLLRALPGGAKLPVVALTAGAFKAQQEAAREAGMDAFVAKPFNVDELIATIQRLTHYVPARAAPAAHAPADPVHPALPLDWPGIGVAKGLSIWKDVEVYHQFLRKFSVDYGAACSTLAEQLGEGERAAALALCHKLKGGAANLALNEVALRAGALEEVLHAAGDPAVALQALASALATALASIAEYAAEQASAAMPAAAPGGGETDTLMRALLVALDSDTPDCTHALLAALAPVLSAELSAALRNCIDNFDFRGAEALVHQAAPQLGMAWEE
ncbi:response regulator [Oxalobacteraceae bacterium]|nr:response regulator [Oxalobacteraceae bacterium]